MYRDDFLNFRSVKLGYIFKEELVEVEEKLVNIFRKRKPFLSSRRLKKIIANAIKTIQGNGIYKQQFLTGISMQKLLHNTNQNDNGSSNNEAIIDQIGRM